VDLKKYFLKFTVLFSYLNLLIIFDGNISLRYLYDDISRIIVLGQDFFITPIYIVFLIAIISVLTDSYLESKINYDKNIFFSYIYNFSILCFSTLVIFYFLRIYDVSRFLLILFLITCPIILIFVNKFNIKKIRSPILFTFLTLVIIFNFYINSNSSINKLLKLDTNLADTIIEDEIESVDVLTRYLEFIPSSEINEGIPKEINLSLDYKLTKYQICCFEYTFYENGGKSIGYLEIYENKLIYITGSGVMLYTDISEIENNKSIKFNELKNNLTEIISNNLIFDPIGWESIKDILIMNDEIFISYVEEVSYDCVNNAIIKADFNFEYLSFETLFKHEECVIRSVSPYNAHQSGGKLVKYTDQEIILTTGDFRAYDKPQDINSKLGKILKINLNDGKDQIISLGHRNPQGIQITDDFNFAISSEHGPKGGDEINIINLNTVQNYGWPISSYGTHYDGAKRSEAPLHKSHQDYGFIEPIWYWDYEQNNLHGVGDLERNYYLGGNNYMVATLKGNKIYNIDVDFENLKLNQISSIEIGERVREIIYHKESDSYFLLLENTPAIAVFEKNDS